MHYIKLILIRLKTLLKFIGLKWGKKRGLPEAFAGCSFVYLDNKFLDFFDQVQVFFNSKFLSPHQTVLIVKFYKENYFRVASAAEKIGVRVVFYLFYRQVPNLDGRVVFYPYNSQSNCRLILNRNARHVFLTHGESNKKASVNRMVRLYDYVLGAGSISTERYIESGVFTRNDIESGRVVRVGASLTPKCFGSTSSDELTPCLVYMPTWEGGLEDENYSSIDSPAIVSALSAVLEGLNIRRILIKYHPNTGSRLPSLKDAAKNLIVELAKTGFEVYVESRFYKSLNITPHVAHLIFKKINGLTIKWGITDVSAAEFILAANGIPTLVFCKDKSKIFAPQIYFHVRSSALIDINRTSDFSDGIAYLRSHARFDEFLKIAFQKDAYLDIEDTSSMGRVLISKILNEM